MNVSTGPAAFFTMSGSSPPPGQTAAREAPPAATEPTEMPVELAEALGRLLAEALVADTVESPPGHNRTAVRRRTKRPLARTPQGRRPSVGKRRNSLAPAVTP